MADVTHPCDAVEKGELPDSELCQLSQAGDQDAFSTLVTRYEGCAINFASTIVKNFDVAQELVQESFMEAWSTIDDRDPIRNFYAWFSTIVKWRCIDHLRKRSSGETNMDVACVQDIGSREENPIETLLRNERRDWVRLALEAMDSKKRRILERRHFDGLGTTEISRQDEIPLATASNRVLRAANEFRNLFSKLSKEGLRT